MVTGTQVELRHHLQGLEMLWERLSGQDLSHPLVLKPNLCLYHKPPSQALTCPCLLSLFSSKKGWKDHQSPYTLSSASCPRCHRMTLQEKLRELEDAGLSMSPQVVLTEE